MKQRTFTSLTSEEKQIILAMDKKKMTGDEIGRAFGVSGYTARRWVKWIKNNHKPPAGKKTCDCRNKRGGARLSRKMKVEFVQNPNPPTATTRMLICHYYAEDVTRHKLNHAQALTDISIELGRTKAYISRVLREEQRSGMITSEALKIYTSVMKPIGMKPLSKQ